MGNLSIPQAPIFTECIRTKEMKALRLYSTDDHGFCLDWVSGWVIAVLRCILKVSCISEPYTNFVLWTPAALNTTTSLLAFT